MRCQIFRQHGIGHGDVTLVDALAQSCNVYFFHHVTALGPERLVAWARRFGFGQPVPTATCGERDGGHVPAPAELRLPAALESLAVGQGTLTATPLEVVRMYAAIANGGYLLPVRLVRDARDVRADEAASSADLPEGCRIAGLSAASLATVREGLRRVVDDPAGTAFGTVRMRDLAVAGKTGTAQTGGDGDHAWFAGYAPAAAPRFAFVVAVEQGGSGADVAGAMCRHLLERMSQLGYFGHLSTAGKMPPGRG